VGAIRPAKAHVPIAEAEQAVVGDGDAMGGAGEIREHLIGAGEGRFAVHDPAFGCGALEPVLRIVIAGRGNLGARDRVLEHGQELAAEHRREHVHGEEEVRAGGDPARVLGVPPAARNDAMQMRVNEQELGPGMQDGGDRDRDAKPTAGDLLQGLGDGGEQEAIGHPRGGEEERVQLGGHGEDDMKVLDGEQVAALRFDPPHGLEALALGAMAIATGVVRDLLMPALRTRASVPPERRGAALGEGPEDPLLRRAEAGELGGVGADDVGDLHAIGPIGVHGHSGRPNATGRSGTGGGDPAGGRVFRTPPGERDRKAG
jgi:hypothetical protein